jgi:hypothetical protein
MALLSRIFLVEFGLCMLAAAILPARRSARTWWRQRRQTGFEDAVLLAASAAIGAAYLVECVAVHGNLMPPISGVWLTVFGGSCVLHLATKALRILVKR